MDDLEHAMSLMTETLAAASAGHPAQVGCLSNLSVYFGVEYNYTDEIGDLEQVITKGR